MQLISTRDSNNVVGFTEALLNCMPEDGGLYVPHHMEDLRKWILYADENTTFANLAGTLTSALINTEFSPIICETISTRAFTFSPVVKQLDSNLFIMELYHGPTGTFKDFGVSYLASALETVLQMNEDTSILFDATNGEIGACLANALRGKKLLKAAILVPKNMFRGMNEKDFVWNGGNIYPILVDGTEKDCNDMVRAIFADPELVKKYHLSVANTANIGRLLPQSFVYTYAFSQIKKKLNGDFYFAVPTKNCGNLVAGLYSWQQALPVKGFIIPATADITNDTGNNALIMDSMIPLSERESADPSAPSNIERLEYVFKANSIMLKNFIYPSTVTSKDIDNACKELFTKYHIYADRDTSAAYASYLIRKELTEAEDGTVVLVATNSPSTDEAFIKKNIGEVPKRTEQIKNAFASVETGRGIIQPGDLDYVVSVLNSLNLRRIF